MPPATQPSSPSPPRPRPLKGGALVRRGVRAHLRWLVLRARAAAVPARGQPRAPCAHPHPTLSLPDLTSPSLPPYLALSRVALVRRGAPRGRVGQPTLRTRAAAAQPRQRDRYTLALTIPSPYPLPTLSLAYPDSLTLELYPRRSRHTSDSSTKQSYGQQGGARCLMTSPVTNSR